MTEAGRLSGRNLAHAQLKACSVFVRTAAAGLWLVLELISVHSLSEGQGELDKDA